MSSNLNHIGIRIWVNRLSYKKSKEKIRTITYKRGWASIIKKYFVVMK